MDISASKVKELREKTGAGFMDCKKALGECGGDLDKATDYLRKKGLSAAEKKSGRTTAEGIVYSYIHQGGKIGVLVEVNCETDFVARTDGFTDLVKDIAMHIAAMNPRYVKRADVPARDVEKEREIFLAQARESGKPEKVLDRIVDGKVEKFYKEVCLLEQPFVKNPDETVEKLLIGAVAKLGENIAVRRFARFKVGEGVEKKETDFAKEIEALQA
ncbi:MAG: translation elongation factor Ts [Thermodesulfobacteriota bacterium]